MNAPLLKIEGLHVEFPGLVSTTQAVRGVDLSVGAGSILGLVGESGSGKSMTAMTCLGLIPSPGRVRGSVKIDGYEVIGRAEKELAGLRGGTAAMIFQNPMRALNPFFTIGQQISEVVRCHRPFGKNEAREAALEGLRSVKMPDPEIALGKYPHQMSGGQIQRVMIALALACRPKLLIADEPTTALDVTIQAQIISLIRELADTLSLSVLFITHDLGVVAALCDDVAVMYAGEIVEKGTVEKVFNAATHPYTAKLMETVPAVGRGKAELQSIPGQVPNLAFPPSGCAFHDRCDQATDICGQVAPEMRAFGEGHGAACHHAGREFVVIEGSK
jgi:oligopeptide/dipeptide ABC transporter ATP-binding protein